MPSFYTTEYPSDKFTILESSILTRHNFNDMHITIHKQFHVHITLKCVSRV